MRVLWITNILFPQAEYALGGNGRLKSSGGWLLGAAEALVNSGEINLIIAAPTKMTKEIKKIEIEGIVYYALPERIVNKEKCYKKYWRQIKNEENPDIVHIHGSEMNHGLFYVEECGCENVIVSVQGLISVIAKYYNCGLTNWDIIRHITIRDIIRTTLFGEKMEFEKRGICERKLINKVHHVIGRTSWDRSHVLAINPHINYYFCNETLRNDFYNAEHWKYDNCIPHTIFLSQSSYPVKGLHMVLKAMPLVLGRYPDAKIFVAGEDITRERAPYAKRFLRTGYGSIINSEIKKNKLDGKVSFLGQLDSKEMIREYLRANVFVCSSSIENSPNSLGEAQILGVPVVASFVGGIPDMMVGCEKYLYRFEEIEMLAQKICEVFDDISNTAPMSNVAAKRHDRTNNCNQLLAIYKNLFKA